MSIKKQFVELHELLSANENKKVSSIMDQLVEIMSSQQRQTNHRVDEDGNLWIYCYYHKEWENTSEIEYGKKANTATGLNSMCKIGVNQWTKQQREFKQAKSLLLEQVADGLIAIDEINDHIAALEEEKNRVIPLD